MSSLLPSIAALPGCASPAEQAIMPGSSLSSLLFYQPGLSLFFFSLCPFPRISFQPVQWVGGIVACYCNSFYRSFMFFGLRFTSSVNSSEGSSSFRSSGSSVQVMYSGQSLYFMSKSFIFYFYFLSCPPLDGGGSGSHCRFTDSEWITVQEMSHHLLRGVPCAPFPVTYSWESGGSAHGSLR